MLVAVAVAVGVAGSPGNTIDAELSTRVLFVVGSLVVSRATSVTCPCVAPSLSVNVTLVQSPIAVYVCGDPADTKALVDADEMKLIVCGGG